MKRRDLVAISTAVLALGPIRTLQAQTTTQPGGFSSVGPLSGDGRFVVTFDSFFGDAIIIDRFSGTTSTPAGASTWIWPVISDNAQYVVALDTSGGGRVIVAANPLAPR